MSKIDFIVNCKIRVYYKTKTAQMQYNHLYIYSVTIQYSSGQKLWILTLMCPRFKDVNLALVFASQCASSARLRSSKNSGQN